MTQGSQALTVNQLTCCQFILSFVQHPFQSLLSVLDSPEALGIREEAARSSASQSCGRPCHEQGPCLWLEPQGQF